MIPAKNLFIGPFHVDVEKGSHQNVQNAFEVLLFCEITSQLYIGEYDNLKLTYVT